MKVSKEDYTKQVIKDLDDLTEFINKYSVFINLHSNDFLLSHYWNKYIPDNFFGTLTDADNKIQFSPNQNQCLIKKQNNSQETVSEKSDIFSSYICVEDFLNEISKRTLPFLTSLKSFDALKQEMGINLCNSKASMQKTMSFKKCHEVEVMGNLCSDLANNYNIKSVVDIGSGLGYLGSYLSALHKFDVLGIDSEPGRDVAAMKRNKTLKNQIHALVNDNDQKKRCKIKSCETSQFIPVCEYVTNHTEINNIFKNHFGSKSLEKKNDSSDEMMFTALHACGDLSSHILKLFVHSDRAAVLCLVGCCYNLLTEEFPSNEFHDNSENQDSYGFPMSNHLRNRSFQLGINARSLASQPLDRLKANQTVPSDTLFWRAVLQVILVEKLGNPKNKIDWRVGKLNKKINSFNEYVNKAIQKLNLVIKISDPEISGYYLRYSSHKNKYLAFYKLRTSMGPVIEALIQLDRLLFLLEQENTHSAFLIEVFDPVISPRCYSLIAIKQTSNERF